MLTESHCGLVITHFRNLISKSCPLTAKQIIHTTQSVKASSLSVTHTLCRSLSDTAQSIVSFLCIPEYFRNKMINADQQFK